MCMQCCTLSEGQHGKNESYVARGLLFVCAYIVAVFLGMGVHGKSTLQHCLGGRT